MNSKTNTILKWVGFCLSIYQIIIGLVGTPTSLIHRPLTVGILMLFLFLKDEKDGKKSKWSDWVLAIASLLVCLYAVVNANWFLSRFPYLTPVKVSEYIYGIAIHGLGHAYHWRHHDPVCALWPSPWRRAMAHPI